MSPNIWHFLMQNFSGYLVFGNTIPNHFAFTLVRTSHARHVARAPIFRSLGTICGFASVHHFTTRYVLTRFVYFTGFSSGHLVQVLVYSMERFFIHILFIEYATEYIALH
jgi:hypothetical protein